MDERKFEIIIHATDERLCRRLIQSLEPVVVPENFSAEVQPVTSDEKIFAYETAMNASDAKYKIYIDERAIVTNENFLVELLEIFRDNSIGAITIGDGNFFATQYDLPWREDFSAEFRRAGYRVVSGGNWISPGEKFPLVSIIIPTFNRPKFFREALESALNQTYRNIEIFVSDNSTDDATERLIQTYDDARIKYFRHKNFDANDNWNFARDYNNPAAEYVNWLMDDDLFYPTKIEKMLDVYRDNPDVSLVTSLRNIIDAHGKVIARGRSPFKNSCKISGDDAGAMLFRDFDNYIGEPTTVLIRKKFLRNNDLCWHDDERGFFNLVDMSTWCQLLTRGNLFFIYEPLSCYRTHEEIASDWTYTPPLMAIQWVKLLKSAWDRKVFVKTEAELRRAIIGWCAYPAARALARSLMKNYHGAEVRTLEKYLVMMAQALSNGYKLELLPVEYSEQDEIKKIR